MVLTNVHTQFGVFSSNFSKIDNYFQKNNGRLANFIISNSFRKGYTFNFQSNKYFIMQMDT